MNRIFRMTPSLFKHAETLLDRLMKFDTSADSLVSAYFLEHPGMGQAERGWMMAVLFSVIRHLRTLGACCGAEPVSRRLLLAALVKQGGQDLQSLSAIIQESETAWLESLVKGVDGELVPAVRLDLPDWLHERLEAHLGAAETEKLAAALNEQAPLDLRVNVLKGDRKAIMKRLAEEGINAQEGHLSPLAIRLPEKLNLTRLSLFKEGLVEIQDEGSQLLGMLLAPRRGEMVMDFCAGAGGKTLLLGALMRNTGRVYAADISEKRLAKLKPRLERSGLANIFPMQIASEHDAKLKRFAGKMDRVLVDAPCSGLGTLRRSPDLKWRQTPETITNYAEKQKSILKAAASLVKPGGRLVYATCSLLTEENEAVVDDFLSGHPEFSVIPVGTELKRTGWKEEGEYLSLLPHKHGTDGFYAALLERKRG